MNNGYNISFRKVLIGVMVHYETQQHAVDKFPLLGLHVSKIEGNVPTLEWWYTLTLHPSRTSPLDDLL